MVVHCVLGWCSACWGDILYDRMVYCVVSGVLCGRAVQCVVGWCTMW